MRRVAYSMGSALLVGLGALLSCSGNDFSAGTNGAAADGGEAGADTTAGHSGSSPGGSTDGGSNGDAGEPGATAGTGSGGTGSGGTGNGGTGNGGRGGAAGGSSGPAQERITAAPNFACAIRSDGTIACWGQATKAPAGTFDSISSGGEGEVNACALSGTKVTCWGANSNGQSAERATQYKAVAAGGVFTCGIRSSDSKIECWGIGFATNFMFEATATAVDAGVPVTCALYTNGQIDCKGGSGTNWTTPAGKFAALSTGEHHACAIRDDSSIVCWGGTNLAGEETAPSGSFIAVSAGYLHSCAIRSDNAVACWGDDTHGQASPPAGKFAAVAASIYGFYTCGIRTDGSVACWGQNDSGQTLPPSGSFLPP